MSKETKVKETEQKSNTEKDNDLLDDFKSEVFGKGKKNVLAVFGYFFVILIVFGLLGVAIYQIFFKPEALENKTASEKIQSMPVVEETKEQPAEETKTEPTPAETPAPAPQPSVLDYTVAGGDTWSSIANANGMSSTELMQYNGVTSEDLQIGQVIKIPKS